MKEGKDKREDPNGKPEGGDDNKNEAGSRKNDKKNSKEPEKGASDLAYGTCRYCKQMKIAYPVGVFDQEALDDQATEGCDCAGAKNARELQKRYDQAIECIDKTVEAMQSRNVIPGGEDIAELSAEAMKAALDTVWEGVFDSVAITVRGNQIKISKPKDKVRISKRRTLTADIEF